jgi:uncharacterized protein YcbK (DUF882 family)
MVDYKLSANFFRSEFACKCGCGFDTVDAELIIVLQDIRDHFNQPVDINCGCRCRVHNNRTPGAGKNSQHLYGRAADIRVSNVQPATVQEYLRGKYPGKYGIGHYYDFTHIDTRTGSAARW